MDAERGGRRAGRPGRNAPCWCGSGRRYKACHEAADQGTPKGPDLAAILQEVAGPFPGEPTLERVRTAARLAAVAWNATRRPDPAVVLDEAAARLAAAGDARTALRRALDAMAARAARWPDDPRVVLRAEVSDDGRGGFTFRVSSAIGEVPSD